MTRSKGAKANEPRPTLSDRLAVHRRRKDTLAYDWASSDSDLLALALSCATTAGAAVIIGSAQGGRAIVLTIMDGDDRVREYCNFPEELTDFCNELIDLYQSSSEDARTSWAAAKGAKK